MLRIAAIVLSVAIGITVIVILMGLLVGVTNWADLLVTALMTLLGIAGMIACVVLLGLLLSAATWQFHTIKIVRSSLDANGILPHGFIPINTNRNVWFAPDLGDVIISGPIQTSADLHVSKGTIIRASEPIYTRTITARIIVSSEPLQDYTRYHPNCGDIISSSTAVGDLNG